MRIWSRIRQLSTDFAAYVLIGITVTICIDVAGRKLFSSPIPASEVYIRFAFAIITFLVFAQLQASGIQVRMEVFTGKLPPKVNRALGMLYCLIGLVAFGLLLVSGYGELSTAIRQGQFELAIVRVPSFIPWLGLVVGVALFLIELIAEFILNAAALFARQRG